MHAAVFLAAAIAIPSGDESIARVNGTTITRTELLRRHESVQSQGIQASVARVLESLVNEVLLASEAKRLRLPSDPAIGAEVDAEGRRALGDAFIEKEVETRLQVDDPQLRAMFHASSDFVWFESLTFETAGAAGAAASRIHAGAGFATEAPGAVVARLHPDPGKAPPSMRAELGTELADALFAAKAGEVVGPVKASVGFVVARLLRKEVGDEAAFAARREALLARARKQAATQMREHVTTQLRARSGARVDEPLLRRTRWTEVTPSQLDQVVAIAGEHRVRLREVQHSASAMAARGGHAAGPELAVTLAWQEVDAWLLFDAAVAQGRREDPATAARVLDAERRALAAAALDAIRRSAPPPGEREIEEFYRRNAARFGRPFEEVLAQAAAAAANAKREERAASRIDELRREATLTIDRDALSRAAQGR